MTRHVGPWRLPLLSALLLVVGGMLAISGFSLWQLYVETIGNGYAMSEMYTRGFEDVLTQSLYMTEMIAANNFENERPRTQPQHLAETFATTLHRTPFLRSLSVVDEHDRIVASSNAANVGLHVARGSYLPPAADAVDVLRVGTPWSGRDFFGGRPLTDQAPSADDGIGFLPLTLRLTTHEGTLDLLIALNPDYFINHFSQKLDTAQGSVEVLRYDGIRLLATDPRLTLGTPWMAATLAPDFAEREFGRLDATADAGGHPALTTFRASRLYPVVVVTHLDRAHALRNWTSATITLLSVVPPVLLVLTLISVAYYRRRLQENAQREEAARIKAINATVFDLSHEATLIAGSDAVIVSVNAAFVQATGYVEQEVIGRALYELLTPEGATTLREATATRPAADATAGPAASLMHEAPMRCKDGSLLWMEILSTPERVPPAWPALHGYRHIARNITERREMQEQVRAAAFHDHLTGLPNRRLLADRLSRTLAACKRSGGHGAVLFLDLDHFKPLNDTYGHVAGDLLLCEVAARLSACVREIDTVARFGGDEFVVVLGVLDRVHEASRVQATAIAEKVSAALARPYSLDVQGGAGATRRIEHTCTSSIGGTLFAADEYSTEDILKRADAAMYHAKHHGRARIHFA